MIMHIVGNRPQFIKLAPVSKEISKRGYHQMIVHTGQHYDENMSDIFFEELEIQKPDKNLAIGSGTHAQMTGKAMIEIENVLKEYLPDGVILYGDTDSTLAGAIATVKLNIPIIHIEAGIRTGGLKNPEEANRIITDHLSELLFCSDSNSVNNLKKEGICKNVYQVGDVMYDTFLQYRNHESKIFLKDYHLKKDNYILMTWHRQENTNSKERMLQIIQFLKRIPYEIIYPMHPRTKAKLMEYQLLKEFINLPNIRILPPVGYLEMIKLMTNAHMILTDSGGVSKESFFAGVKCILMVNLDLWPDLIEHHWITKIDLDSETSINQVLHWIESNRNQDVFHLSEALSEIYGNGNASIKIVDILEKKYKL